MKRQLPMERARDRQRDRTIERPRFDAEERTRFDRRRVEVLPARIRGGRRLGLQKGQKRTTSALTEPL